MLFYPVKLNNNHHAKVFVSLWARLRYLRNAGAHVSGPPKLRECISHYTFYAPQSTIAPGSLTIVPDASGSIVYRFLKVQEAQRVETWFWGPTPRVVVVKSNPAKYPLYIMVEFLPCSARRLFGIPMDGLHNGMIPLHTLDAALHNLLVDAMEQLITNSQGVAAVCASLDAAFLRLLAQSEAFRFARHVVSQVRITNGTVRVSELSRQIGCSPRQLAKVMSEWLGMPIKSLVRIIRINAVCRCMDARAVSLTQLAHSLHYHDQSHFIHDFTAICSVTPEEYLSHMSHFYNEKLKLGAILPDK